MVCYSLDPENPTKSRKSRGSKLRVHVKNTHETSQAIKGMHIRTARKYLKDVTLQKQWCHSLLTMVGLVGVPGPNSGARLGIGGPKRALNLCCTGLKVREEC